MARPTLTLIPVEGRVPYRDALAWQRRIARARIEAARRSGADAPTNGAGAAGFDAAGAGIEGAAGLSAGDDIVLLLEHEPVVTLGRGAESRHVVAPAGSLAALGIDRVEVERGGDVTYHGPGQLVGYPILDLGNYRRDLHWYLRRLEEALIRALGELGLTAFRVGGHTGVWVGEAGHDVAAEAAAALVAGGRVRKIASIGVHVSRWVTWHGFALNVTDEPLRNFGLIVPCGIDDVRMTSLASEGVMLSGEPHAPRASGPVPAAAAYGSPGPVQHPRIMGALGDGFAGAFGTRVSLGSATPPPDVVAASA